MSVAVIYSCLTLTIITHHGSEHWQGGSRAAFNEDEV